MNPLVTVIMPVFNREGLIAESLNCLLDQTYQNWECIIIDDASTDSTIDTVKEFAEKDKRFRLVSRPLNYNKGAASCRNIGLRQARGEYIQYLDSDDIIFPKKLELQLDSLLRNPKGSICFCSWSFFKEMPIVYKENQASYFLKIDYKPLEFLEELGLNNTYLPLHSYLTPIEIAHKAGYWNEQITNNDDAEYFTRIIINSIKLIRINEVLAFYRKGIDVSLSSYSSAIKVESVVKSWDMIESSLISKFGKRKFAYVEASKNRLFQNIIWENSPLIENHPIFFRDQFGRLKREKRFKFSKRILRRVKLKLQGLRNTFK